jgi:methyl-accepting chemotaxis protein
MNLGKKNKMKIQRKLLLSYMLIVALFVAIGATMTYNSYQTGFLLMDLAFQETQTDPEAAAADSASGQSLTAATGTYLLDNLPQDGELYTKFLDCNQIHTDVITPALAKASAAYAVGNIAEVNTQMAIVKNGLSDLQTDLDNFQLLVVESIQASTAEAQSYANFSVMLSVAGIGTITAISIVMAIVMGKRITDPLKKLTSIAGKVSMGELEHEIKFNTKDEISDLGEAFQRMINAFKMTSAMNETIEEEKS